MNEEIFKGLIFQWQNGKTYHLNIDEDDLASYILTMGSGNRLDILKGFLEEVKEGGGRLRWVKGYYKDISVFAFTSGMGVASASIAFTEVFKKLLDGVRHAYIIRVGTAGALVDIPKYSLVIPVAAMRNEHVSRYLIHAGYPSAMDPVIYLTGLQTAMDMGYRLNEDLFYGVIETKDDLYFQEGFHNSPLTEKLRVDYRAIRRMGVLASEMETSLLPILRDYFKKFAEKDGITFRTYVGAELLILKGELDKNELDNKERTLVELGLETLNNINKFLRGDYNLENILRFISS